MSPWHPSQQVGSNSCPGRFERNSSPTQITPPMQDPETYNLDQVIQQIKEQRTTSHGGD